MASSGKIISFKCQEFAIVTFFIQIFYGSIDPTLMLMFTENINTKHQYSVLALTAHETFKRKSRSL